MSQTQERPAAKSTTRANALVSFLVHAEPGAASTHRVEVASRLARDHGARLIGLGAEAFEPILTVDPFFGYAAAEWVTLVQEQIATSLKNAETAFRRDAAGADVEWRSVEDNPARALANAARAADVIVMSPKGKGGRSRTADPADVVMTSGRPVLMVPDSATHLHGKVVVVAWKDTREARRAVADAMDSERLVLVSTAGLSSTSQGAAVSMVPAVRTAAVAPPRVARPPRTPATVGPDKDTRPNR